MLETVAGRVWQLDVTTEELPALRGKYLETGLLREGGRIHIRIVSDAVDGNGFRSVVPTLEDAYIWLMREEQDERPDEKAASNGGS
jgi:hypothetical protein